MIETTPNNITFRMTVNFKSNVPIDINAVKVKTFY